jgi:hypothetical protein
MTKRQVKIINDYINYLQKALTLRDWQIDVIDYQKDDETCFANISISKDYNQADITISNLFYNLSNKGKSETLIHELVHLYWHDSTRWIDHDLEQYMGKPAFILLEAAYWRDVERGVEQTAKVLAKKLKKIKWEEEQ